MSVSAATIPRPAMITPARNADEKPSTRATGSAVPDATASSVREVAIVGDPRSTRTRELSDEVTTKRFLPNHVLAVADEDDRQAREAVDAIRALAERGFDEGVEPAEVEEGPRRTSMTLEEGILGLPASPGIAVGEIRRFHVPAIEVPERQASDAAEEDRRLDAAIAEDEDSKEYLARLEALASEERMPSGDEIASEIERYLKEQT